LTTDRFLICTDLDRTLIPNGSQPESENARKLFSRLASRPEVCLVYVSGRHRELVEEAIASWQLPIPDFVIGDVGTTIYRVGSPREWQHLVFWEQRIAEDWGRFSQGDLLRLLGDVPALEPQEASRQNRFKLSFNVSTDQDTGDLSGKVRQRLDAAGVRSRLVWSVDDIEGVGLLDVIPEQASKRHAIEALMEQEGYSLDETVFCGDSGNDLEVLISPIPSVLVANSRDEVKRRALHLATEAGTARQLYISKGNFLGMNGNYGAGMLEGIAHYLPGIVDWLIEPVASNLRSMQ
jgi:HAD superfamily hydrolase (TIGR01484 family)